MPYRWPEGTVFRRLELEVEDRACRVCHDWMYVCDHRHHRIFTLVGPMDLVSKLVHCPAPTCPGHPKTFSPEAEMGISLPWWVIGWDVFCWIGQRRFARHWSVSEIRAELEDSYQIGLSSDAVERYVRRYQQMLAARQQDPQGLADEYRQVESLVLCIDGLQPEKGHETLYVVRELSRKRVWFAESLISSTAAEVRRLLAQAREWAARLGKPVRGWMSDKQEAFRSGIAAEFPGVPHRYCRNHFLRDLAQPVLDLDSHAKVQMRAKVRGLRAIEREVLQARMPRSAVSAPVAERSASSAVAEPALPLVLAEPVDSAAVSQRVPAAPVLERTGASAASSPAQSLVVAESLALPVLAEEDLSPAVSQTVPAGPVLERAGASAAPSPAQPLVVAESLALPVLAEEDLSPAVSQTVPAGPVLERAGASGAPRPAQSLVVAESLALPVPAGPILERAGASAAPRPAQSLVVAESLALPVVAEEDPSPAVSQTVPAAPILERAGASAAPSPAQPPVVGESLAVPVLAEEDLSPAVSQSVPAAPVVERAGASVTVSERPDAGEVVLDYCTAVRGILNDDQGGPLHPCGVRMAAALGEVRQSLERSLAAKKGGAHTSNYDG